MNHIDKDLVQELAQALIEELKEGIDDLIYNSWIEQAVRLRVSNEAQISLYLMNVLEEMLKSREVEIGGEVRRERDGVKYIAWEGTVEQRIARAFQETERARQVNPNWGLCAYWLRLREKIDGYEGSVATVEPKTG